ncbi:MAG: glycosyltransferase [Kiritimatiellae bacterium]|nr:glycosyltransferase [Kiritimatiellia bacterium]
MSAGIYMADMVDAFLPALQEEDTVSILLGLTSCLPWEPIEHPSVHYIIAHENPYTVAGRYELAQLCRTILPDVWWSADAALVPPPRTKQSPIKIIFAIEALRHLYGTHSNKQRFQFLTRWHARQNLLGADALICPNKAVATHTVHELGLALRRKVAVIPSGIHPVFRLHSDEEIVHVRRQLLIPQRYLLIVSTSATAHYLTPVLEALGTNEEVSSVTCVILGDAELPDKLREVIRDCHLEGMVRFLNNAKLSPNEISCLYSGAFLLFEPSQDVAYFPSILRAMACGTPVVCAASKANEDLFGQAVLRVHPTNTREWSQALTTLTLSTTLRDRQIERGLTFSVNATSTAMAKHSFTFARQLCTDAATAFRKPRHD